LEFQKPSFKQECDLLPIKYASLHDIPQRIHLPSQLEEFQLEEWGREVMIKTRGVEQMLPAQIS
jgi:hypothetical protein